MTNKKILVTVTTVYLIALYSAINYLDLDMDYDLDLDLDSNLSKVEKTKTSTEIEQRQGETEASNATKPSSDLKYILQWTRPTNVPFVYMGKGQSGFIDMKCPYTNCYVTADRDFLGGDYTKFDVIAFVGPEVIWYPPSKLPNKRSPHQKYVFASIESADNYPVCDNRFDGFFNWTWTYRLDSESRWGYVVVREADGKLIGPNKQMSWIQLKDMDPVSDNLKKKLKSKNKTAAWLVSNCKSKSKREDFVAKLQLELAKYNMHVDVYGKCGPLNCSTKKHDDCLKKIENEYYFYLSFENSFAEDYVTEKLIHALQHNAVPIVYGGANYSSFMPVGIYLNARELGVEALAVKMYELINNTDDYLEYFRWKSHYSFYRRMQSIETNDYCSYCALLNNKEALAKRTVYKKFINWWTPPGSCNEGRSKRSWNKLLQITYYVIGFILFFLLYIITLKITHRVLAH